ncbi:hypothetical protein TUMEXPCC7403_16925 [Tumidithrix helvetica PCC 7403]
MKVCLTTANREFIREAEIPPFQTAPTVILWGDRVFIRDTTVKHAFYFRECFFCIVN